MLPRTCSLPAHEQRNSRIAPWLLRHRHSLAEKLLGKGDALRELELEQYTAAEMGKLIRAHNLADAVDFLDGGRTELCFTQAECGDARADYEAAKAAGANLQGVEWLSNLKEEVEAVSRASRVLSVSL